MEKNSSIENPQLLDVFATLFIATLIISQVMAQKLFIFYDVTFTAAIIVFPVSYIIGDILTEVYGYARTRRIIWLGFGATLLMALLFQAAVALPAAPGWPNQAAFELVLDQVPRTVAASLAAYLAGEFVNSYVLSKIKVITDGKHLWFRTILSTIVGQSVDTSIFVLVAFWGVLPGGILWTIIWSAYIFKVTYEILATPLTYVIVHWVKRVEGLEVFDTQTNYMPFRISLERKQ